MFMGFALPSPPTPSTRAPIPAPSPESEPGCVEGEDEADTCIQSQGSEQGSLKSHGVHLSLGRLERFAEAQVGLGKKGCGQWDQQGQRSWKWEGYGVVYLTMTVQQWPLSELSLHRLNWYLEGCGDPVSQIGKLRHHAVSTHREIDWAWRWPGLNSDLCTLTERPHV